MVKLEGTLPIHDLIEMVEMYEKPRIGRERTTTYLLDVGRYTLDFGVPAMQNIPASATLLRVQIQLI